MQVRELDVHREPAPAGGRVVDDVVVDQRERVQQFERSADVVDQRIVGVAASGDEPPVAESWAQALAASLDEGPDHRDRFDEVGVDETPSLALGVEQAREPSADSVGDRREARGCSRRWHRTS